MGRPSVYLAGPITGLTYGESSDWRDAVKEELDDAGIAAFSPLRMKGYLESFGVLSAKGQDGYNYSGAHPLSEDKGIMTRDRFDVRTRDMVLANFLGAERVSIGTCIEIGWADAFRKPVVAVMEDDNVHRHAMLDEGCGFVVKTLDQAVEIVKAVLLP
jgi:nucleoside 2-deoxyribosyltransferase